MTHSEPPAELKEALGSLPVRKRQNPKMVECPKCKTIGLVQKYRESRCNRPIAYVVNHEIIDGIWCNGLKRKNRRCYGFTEAGKKYLEDQIKFYEERFKREREERIRNWRICK